MNRQNIRILIVEDDATQGKALFEAFKRAGFDPKLCESSVAGLTQAQRVEYHVMIVDCMLPKMNGVDLVEEINGLIPHKPVVFMISGIYKDRIFIQESMRRTGATKFYVKPLPLEEIVGQVEHLAATKEELKGQDKPPVLSLYGQENPNAQDLAALIEQEPTLHAFHLPKLYARLQQAGVTGDLTLISAVGELSSVSFYEGQIFTVKTPDKESFFGSLAISKGFVAPEDVLEALRDTRQKMLGQKLIEAMSLSPHAIDIILEEQLALRLSQTVQDDVVSLQWMNKPHKLPQHQLAPERFHALEEDWLNSKMTPDWVHSTLMVWGGFQLEGNYHVTLRGGHTIEDLFKNPEFNATRDLMPLFRALIFGQAQIGVRVSSRRDFSFLDSRLDRMLQDFKTQNYFQFLGVGEKAHQREVSRSYESFKEAFDPALLPADCPADVREKCERIFEKIQKAYNTISNDVERNEYMNLLHSRRKDESQKAEPIFLAAILDLQAGQAREAAQKLQSLIDRKLEFKDLRSYRLWAGLKSDRSYTAIRLDQIPPEERHSAPYMMAKGVHYRYLHQYKKALEAFRTAHVLDPRLSIAKYELQRLMMDLEKGGSQNRKMLKEVTAVMTDLFGPNSVKKGA